MGVKPKKKKKVNTQENKQVIDNAKQRLENYEAAIEY